MASDLEPLRTDRFRLCTGDFLEISGTGQVDITRTGSQKRYRVRDVAQLIGPWPQEADCAITAGADGATYTVHRERETQGAQPVTFDPDSGALIAGGEEVEVGDSPPSCGGVRTVLFGDSMTDWYNFGSGSTGTSAYYDAATGRLTMTGSGTHELYDGVMARIWHSSYASMQDQVYVPLTVTSSTVTTAVLAAGLAGVPATDIKANLSVYVDNKRAINSFVSWLQMMMGWRLNVVRNAAQSGVVIAGNVRRLTQDIAAYTPDLVIGHTPGINDLRSDDDRSEAQIIADLTTLYEGILATGATLILGNLSPVSSTETDRAYRSNMMMVLRVNDWIRRYAATKPAMHVINHYRHFVDISNTTGLALSARVRNDGIHPATKTSILTAKAWAAVLSSRIPALDSTLPQSILDCHPNSRLTVSSASATSGVVTVSSTSHKYKVGDEFRALSGSKTEANGWFTVASAPSSSTFTYAAPGISDGSITGLLISRSRNLFTNPLLQTASGGNVNTGGSNTITGTAAGNITVSNGIGSGCTAVASVVAAVNVGSSAVGYSTLPEPVGNEQVLAVSAATASNRPGIATYGTTAFSTQMLIGRSYIAEAILRIQSTDWTQTQIKNLLATFSVSIDSGSYWMKADAAYSQDTSETDVIAEDMRLHLRTPVIKLTSGSAVSAGDFTFGATVQNTFSAGPVLTLALSQINIVDVTGQEELYR